MEVRDQLDNVVTSNNSNVTIGIGTNAGNGSLTGSTTVTAINGVATFTGLSINKAGNGYTLVATDGGLGSATSSPQHHGRGSHPAGLRAATEHHRGRPGDEHGDRPVARCQWQPGHQR